MAGETVRRARGKLAFAALAGGLVGGGGVFLAQRRVHSFPLRTDLGPENAYFERGLREPSRVPSLPPGAEVFTKTNCARDRASGGPPPAPLGGASKRTAAEEMLDETPARARAGALRQLDRGPRRETLRLEPLPPSLVVHVNAQVEGVVLPAEYPRAGAASLQVGYRAGAPAADLRLDQGGLSVTLASRGQPFRAYVPWAAVFGLTTEEGQGFLWAADAPVGYRCD
jgi:hypothetical protein